MSEDEQKVVAAAAVGLEGGGTSYLRRVTTTEGIRGRVKEARLREGGGVASESLRLGVIANDRAERVGVAWTKRRVRSAAEEAQDRVNERSMFMRKDRKRRRAVSQCSIRMRGNCEMRDVRT